MPDYDLARLSPRSFEHLVQAIAVKVIGPGVTIFGDGPDGGREATFEGRAPFPSSAQPADGYWVLQAKFLQRPRDPKFDGRWVLGQIRKELQAYSTSAGRRVPDHYIVATNVVMTPAARTGIKDKANTLFRKHVRSVPIKSWHFWDVDQLRAFIDSLPDVRRTYAAWITPGDVLADMLKFFQPSLKDATKVFANFLAKELLNDQFANLEQAGHAPEDRIPLARVFVDLPISSEPLFEPPRETRNPTERLTGAVKEVVAAAGERLDPASLAHYRTNARLPEHHPEAISPGRFVLIGGPGQGKTTLGQFVCQLFRTALLCDRPQHEQSAEVAQAIRATLELAASESVPIPPTRRFPIRIVLNEFAVAVQAATSTGGLTVLAYVSKLIKRRTDVDVSVDDLRHWLATYPWLIVFDGLDEVPPSSNRDELLRRIEDFWIDAAQSSADVLVLATTRPQGYNQDFSPNYYRHVWLVPLSVPRAMHYAYRLVLARYGSDEDRQNKILARLRQASGHDATARLMRSPLQITIMATLVDQIGQPPQDRWRLFHEYYQVIYRREMERDIPAAQLLREHRKDIDTIHTRVALLLQVESERSGRTEARLTTDRLRALVDDRLAEEDYGPSERSRLRERIIEAAANRLVFLVGLRAGQIGFEVRSLQEFMAAEALMNGTETCVQERLRHIAPLTSWRNVFLFAAGRCFAEVQHLRDTVHTICVSLNEDLGGVVARSMLTGSMLALDLLEDGVARRQPKYSKLLGRCALRLLDLDPSEFHSRLANMCEADTEDIFLEEIRDRLSRMNFADRLGAWATLLPLTARRIGWADLLAKQNWPRNFGEQVQLHALPATRRVADWVRAQFIRIAPRMTVDELWGTMEWVDSLQAKEAPDLWWIWAVTRGDATVFRPMRIWLEIALPKRRSFVTLRSVTAAPDAPQVRRPRGPVHRGWLPVFEGARFARKPTRGALARALRNIAASGWSSQDDIWFLTNLPWPLAACLATAKGPEDLEVLAHKAAAGALGDQRDWKAAETRWIEKSVTEADLAAATDDRWPFDAAIGTVGFPFASCRFNFEAAPPFAAELERLAGWWLKLPENSALRGVAAAWLLSLVRESEVERSSLEWLTPSVMCELAKATGGPVLTAHMLRLGVRDGVIDESWLKAIDELGTCCFILVDRSESHVQTVADAICATVERGVVSAGLVRLLANLALEGCRGTLTAETLRRIGFGSGDWRHSALILQVVYGDAESVDVASVARVATEVHAERENALGFNEPVADLVNALTAHELFGDMTDALLLHLRGALPATSWRERSRVLRGLSDSVRRHRSRLDRAEIWQHLGLPPSLFGRLADAANRDGVLE